jgi:hypothetical protein
MNTSSGVLNTTTGITNYTSYQVNLIQNCTNKTFANSTYSQALVTMGHPGIGLPAALFNLFVPLLQNVTGTIFRCNKTNG